MIVPRKVLKAAQVETPRRMLVDRAQHLKAMLISEVERGTRDTDKLHKLLDEYIEAQMAIDVLAGYLEVERVI